ncbi:DUF1766-domain-containing protein [Parathielavia appendiculata]|uniref:DUF1766-domain-containing protein n=1 Tax=Parathielavia appendiculata TaxID=2587402 RepID=A0AAN6YYV0_9PEZI|nr:DUF1766-domain-containing protein [Parathielavia appendiculata]
MPFYANTPESRLGRSDSKNPSTTCRGITSSGRPCRRPIATPGPPSNSSRLKPSSVRTDDPTDENLYCWQHKDQASASAKSSPGPRMSHTPVLEERTSLDTLADRLGLIRTWSDKLQPPPKGSGRSNGNGNGKRSAKMARPKPRKEATFCFCFRIPVDEIGPPPRPRPHPIQPTSVSTPSRPSEKKPSGQYLSPSPSPGRRALRTSEASQTAHFMSLIPPDTSPQTASQLLAEFAKPVSQQDEPGYIYIFWLTSEAQPATPPAEAARSLLAPPSTPATRSRAGGRRPSDVLASFATIADDEDGSLPSDSGHSKARGMKKKRKILLKIGRATNVQRRLNEWQRQCGYNLSLIRYYPYIPSSPSSRIPSPTPSPRRGDGDDGEVMPRKMPHSHKVERLVHIELAGRGLRVADRERCEACGREHREWFEVKASREAVKAVDEVVRRWVEWDEGFVW